MGNTNRQGAKTARKKNQISWRPWRLGGFLFLCTCASGAGQSYLWAKGQGDRAYSSGRYEEAAGAYDEAGKVSKKPRDRAEALYLEASAFARARVWDRAREILKKL